MPSTPYIISGTILTSKGTIANSLVRINSDISITTNSKGQYVLDLANLNGGYTAGSSYDIEANDEFDNEYKADTITVTGESQTKNLFLDSRTTGRGPYTGYSNPTEFRTVGNKVVTLSNPLVIQNTDRPLDKRMFKVSGTNRVEYIGEAAPGTPTNQPRWRIKKLVYNGVFTSTVLWAEGNAEFNKILDNRVSYQY